MASILQRCKRRQSGIKTRVISNKSALFQGDARQKAIKTKTKVASIVLVGCNSSQAANEQPATAGSYSLAPAQGSDIKLLSGWGRK